MKQKDVIGFGSGSFNGRPGKSSSLSPGLSSGLKSSQVSIWPGRQPYETEGVVKNYLGLDFGREKKRFKIASIANARTGKKRAEAPMATSRT